jgi:hypothetical protein
MKKIIIFISICFCFATSGLLSSCGSKEYEAQSGLYELVSMTGDITKDQFEYFTVELFANGDCVIKSKQAGSSQKYEAKATFEIKDAKIFFYTSNGIQTITEEYDYVDEEIRMNNVKVQEGVTYSAVLRRNQEIQA